MVFRNTGQLFFIISQTEVNFKGKQEKNDDKISKELAKQSIDLQWVWHSEWVGGFYHQIDQTPIVFLIMPTDAIIQNKNSGKWAKEMDKQTLFSQTNASYCPHGLRNGLYRTSNQCWSSLRTKEPNDWCKRGYSNRKLLVWEQPVSQKPVSLSLSANLTRNKAMKEDQASDTSWHH